MLRRTYVGRKDGVVGTATSVEDRLIGGTAEVDCVVVGGTGGATSPDVVLIDLVGWAVDVLGAVDRTAVPRRLFTRAAFAVERLTCSFCA